MNNTGDSEMEAPQPLPKPKRPVFLTIICLFGLVYFFVFSILFLSGFFFAGWVTDAINLYTPVDRYSGNNVRLIMGMFSLLFILSLSGIIAMWNMRRYGYYIFGISSLILASFQLFQPKVSFSGPVFFIVLLILFGLYFRRFR